MRRFDTLACLILIPMTHIWAQLVAEPQRWIDGGIHSILEPGRGWELIGGGFQLTADSAVDEAGNVYPTDARNRRTRVLIIIVLQGGRRAAPKSEPQNIPDGSSPS